MILKVRPVNRLTRLVAFIRMLPELDIDRGGWIAGGAARTVFQDEELAHNSDIDIFGASSHQVNRIENSYISMADGNSAAQANGFGTTSRSIRVAALDDEPVFPVQAVRSGYYRDTQSLFESFDFTVCQFATDGHRIIYTEQAERDLERKALSAEAGYERVKSRPHRVVKYIKRGFEPRPGMLLWALDLHGANTQIKPNLKVGHDGY